MTLHLNYNALYVLQHRMLSTMLSLTEVTDGSYVCDTMFTESAAASATVMDDILRIVVPCANTMEDIFEAALAYFDKIIDDFQAVDIQLAIEAERMGGDNARDAPVNLPGH